MDLGNYNARMGKVSLDLPRMGILRASVGARAEKRDGWVKATAGSSVSELNDRDTRGGRVALNFDLGRDLQIDYRFDTSRVEQNSRFSQVVRSTVATDFGFPGIVVTDGARPAPDSTLSVVDGSVTPTPRPAAVASAPARPAPEPVVPVSPGGFRF